MNALVAIDESLPGLSDELSKAVKDESLNARAEQTYKHWITQYLTYFDLQSPKHLSETNVKEFLRHLGKHMRLSRARLNQAKEALIFLYDKVLHRPLKRSEIAP